MRKVRPVGLFLLGILVCALSFVGCSGSSHSTTITLSPASAQTLNLGQTLTITATVTNDKNNQGVTWSLTGGGALSGNTTTSVVYTAPTNASASTTATVTATSVANTSVTAAVTITVNSVLTITTASLPAGTLGVSYNAFINAAGATGTFTWSVTSGGLPAGLTFVTSSTSSAQITGTPSVLETSKFTVQVTDSSGASASQALSITINPPPPLSVATASLPNGTIGTPYNQALQASSGVPPYTWNLSNGTLLPSGLSLSPGGVISGTPTASGTSNFTVQVTDSSTPTAQTATANLSITINPGNTNNLRLNGNYAFSVRGFDPSGLFVAAGSFIADGNGNISSGMIDTNNTVAPTNDTFTGTYLIGQNGLGYVTFNIASGGSRTFELSMMANGNANIIEFDDATGAGTRNSGVLLIQDKFAFSTSSITGGYAFGFLGIDASKNRFGVAGDLQADGSGNFTSGELDSDAVSGASGGVTITGGTYSVASNGRGTATITTAQGTTNYAFYVVNAGELLAMEIDPFPASVVSGSMLKQTSGSDFDSTCVFEMTALNQSGPTAESQVGLFTAIGGNFNLTSDQNSGGTLTSPMAGAGTYSITSGRVTLTGTGFQNSLPVLYMINPNQAFIIGTDSAVSFGFMTLQSSGFSLSGTYAGGSLPPVDPDLVSNVVSIAIAGSNNLNVTADVSNKNGLSQNQISAGTTAVDSQGRVVVTENGSTTEILYLISGAEFFALTTDASARVDFFQQ